jgi:peptide-methionine (R)-S-oxide reductase
MSRRVLVLALIVAFAPAAGFPPVGRAQELPSKPRKVRKTDAEWQKLLTPQQFLVTRRKATEPAFSGRYAVSHARGTYACICCGAPLFSSTAKFDSGTGWPSFWRPIDPKMIDTARDLTAGEPRIEVMCNDCGSHLGHVFDDGPPPTGLRYCINSLSLKLVPATATSASTKKGAAKTKKGGKSDSPVSNADAPASNPDGQDTSSGRTGDSKQAETKPKDPAAK